MGGGVVYLGGVRFDSDTLAWYRVDVESLIPASKEPRPSECRRAKKKVLYVKKQSFKRGSICFQPVLVNAKPKKIKPMEILRVKLNTEVQLDFGDDGSCAMIGDYIYWFGGSLPCTMTLLKHGLNDPYPMSSSWYILSSNSTDYPPLPPISVYPVGRKIYALRGTVADQHLHHLCGDIYDLDSNTWENLKGSFSTCTVRESYCPPYVALAENEDGEPKEFVFYSIAEGSVLFFDLNSGELRNDEDHPSLALLNLRETPLELEGCVDLGNLIDAITNGPAMLSNNTLYWFTFGLHLYGYDINLKRWFQSPSLAKQLPTVKPLVDDVSFSPFLVDMHNGKFVVITPEVSGEFTVATLTVSRKKESLSVSVESVYPLSFDDPFFMPRAEMSMLKNSRSSIMHGPVKSARET